MRHPPDNAAAVGIAAKVAFLRRPQAWPETAAVDVVETHMSWVFLTDHYVYKLKKPMRLERLDFSTLEARRWNCQEELRLNRELAGPEVYLDVLPLVWRAGELTVGGDGETVDWLVKMARLPRARLLDRAIREGTVDADAVRRAARRLQRFHAAQPPEPFAPGAYPARVAARVSVEMSELGQPEWRFDAEILRELADRLGAFVAREGSLLEARARDGRIVEGHGDLRPEHVCLLPEPVIIDRLEFDRDLRVADTADELALLGMECERLGASWVGAVLLEVMRDGGDDPPERLVQFYAALRACTRARLAIWHLADPAVRDHERWRGVAATYLGLALAHARASFSCP